MLLPAVLAEVEHEPGFLESSQLEVLQRRLSFLVEGIGVCSCLQKAESYLVIVVEYGLPDGGEPGTGFLVRVSAVGQQAGDNHFTSLPGGYLQRGEAVVQGIGISPAGEHLRSGVFNAFAAVLVAALELADEKAECCFPTVARGVGVCALMQQLLHALLVGTGGGGQELLVQ